WEVCLEDGHHVQQPLAALENRTTPSSLAWSHRMAKLGPEEEWSSDGDCVPDEKRSQQETRQWLRLRWTWMARLKLLRT
ncbi:hypothetical protein XENOCAPTIV_016638, partial [Xenoophorus captivus]